MARPSARASQCGEFDEARPETVRQQAALTPDAEVSVVPGAGHLTMIDAPEQSNDGFRRFLARVERSASRSSRGAPDPRR